MRQAEHASGGALFGAQALMPSEEDEQLLDLELIDLNEEELIDLSDLTAEGLEAPLQGPPPEMRRDRAQTLSAVPPMPPRPQAPPKPRALPPPVSLGAIEVVDVTPTRRLRPVRLPPAPSMPPPAKAREAAPAPAKAKRRMSPLAMLAGLAVLGAGVTTVCVVTFADAKPTQAGAPSPADVASRFYSALLAGRTRQAVHLLHPRHRKLARRVIAALAKQRTQRAIGHTVAGVVGRGVAHAEVGVAISAGAGAFVVPVTVHANGARVASERLPLVAYRNGFAIDVNPFAAYDVAEDPFPAPPGLGAPSELPPLPPR